MAALHKKIGNKRWRLFRIFVRFVIPLENKEVLSEKVQHFLSVIINRIGSLYYLRQPLLVPHRQKNTLYDHHQYLSRPCLGA